MPSPTARLLSFTQEIESVCVPRDPRTIWNCEAAFRHIATLDFALEILHAELSSLLDPAYTSPTGTAPPNELLLYTGPGYALTLSLLSQPQRYIHAQSYYGMFSPLSGALGYDIYQLPQNYVNEIFDPSVTLSLAGSGHLRPGELLCLRTDQHAYDLRADQPTLGLRLITAPVRALEWLFSRDSLRAWQANDADLHFTQLRVASYLLGRMAHPSSVEPLKQITDHAHHAVRWASIQALGRISKSEALACLKKAADDPHPHIQRAARKTLEGGAKAPAKP